MIVRVLFVSVLNFIFVFPFLASLHCGDTGHCFPYSKEYLNFSNAQDGERLLFYPGN